MTGSSFRQSGNGILIAILSTVVTLPPKDSFRRDLLLGVLQMLFGGKVGARQQQQA
jgi:hypothetical protein